MTTATAKHRENILILAKTYPSPSRKNTETSCVAGINEHGEMRRLFPIPFRLLGREYQFKKWQWVDIEIEKSPTDKRPESYKIAIDDIKLGAIIESSRDWESRISWIKRVPVATDFLLDNKTPAPALDADISLALYEPTGSVRLEIVSAVAEWTDEEIKKLRQDGGLFSREEMFLPPYLEKIPFDFYYHFTAKGNDIKLKIIDWEVCMLYRNCYRDSGELWKGGFKAKLEDYMNTRRLMFLLGNMHRFQTQWLIISLIYPPKQNEASNRQIQLSFDDL